MCLKYIERLAKTAMLVKAFATASTVISKIPNSGDPELSMDFTAQCVQMAEKLNVNDFEIDNQTLFRAKRIVDYINVNKLILHGYKVEPLDELETIANKLFCLHFNFFVIHNLLEL